MALSSCTEKSAVNHPRGLCMSFPVYDVPCRRKTSSAPLSDYLTVRSCRKITCTDSAGFLLECKEAKALRTEVRKVFADAVIWQKDKEDV